MSDKWFAGESDEYRELRNELLEAEIALKEQRERVAELRRKLPHSGVVPADYVFREGPSDLADEAPEKFRSVRLSELFEAGKDQLIVVHFMFDPAWEAGCPMCSMWADGYDGVVAHIREGANFAVVAKQEIGKLRAWARQRGWRNLRLLSALDNSFIADFGMERGGEQLPGVSVFTRGADGQIRHFYTGCAMMAPGHFRGMDLLSPVWHFFDLLPEGRGDWMPSRSSRH